MENAGADMSMEEHDSSVGDVDSLCDAMESADCQPATNIDKILMGECNLHFSQLQEQYNADNREQDTEALDDWFIDECCDVFVGIMAGANDCMTSETILDRMRELFERFLQSGYLNEELLFEYTSRIFMEYHGTRDSCNVMSSIEDRYKDCKGDEIISTDDSGSTG